MYCDEADPTPEVRACARDTIEGIAPPARRVRSPPPCGFSDQRAVSSLLVYTTHGTLGGGRGSEGSGEGGDDGGRRRGCPQLRKTDVTRTRGTTTWNLIGSSRPDHRSAASRFASRCLTPLSLAAPRPVPLPLLSHRFARLLAARARGGARRVADARDGRSHGGGRARRTVAQPPVRLPVRAEHQGAADSSRG